MYEYRCILRRVIDGDTIDVDIDLGFGVWLRGERVRLYGIDTPESRTRDKVEKKYGLLAKDFLKYNLRSKEGTIVLKTHKDGKGKFGRILGEFIRIENDGHPVYEARINLNQLMIEQHHAVAYHGQSKEEIEEQHIVNRSFH